MDELRGIEEQWRMKEKEIEFWERHGRVPRKEELERMIERDL